MKEAVSGAAGSLEMMKTDSCPGLGRVVVDTDDHDMCCLGAVMQEEALE